MRFEQFGDELGVAVAAAEILRETVAKRRDTRVILPAGRTPLALFKQIARLAGSGRLDLSRVRFFQLDEYVGVGPRDPRSFHSLLRRQLLDPLGRAPERDSLLDGAARDPRAEIERHSARLLQLGGADLAFLGIGTNGHIAFNEPGTAPEQRARVVELARETRRLASPASRRGRSPTRGITLGMHEIRTARRIALLATGAAKTGILAALFEEPPSVQRPASLLLEHRDFTILADAAAAAALHSSVDPAGTRPRRGRAEQGRGAALRS